MKPLDIAINYADGVTKLALAIGVRQSVVSNWRARNTVIEAIHCTAIEQFTKGRVTRVDLRPDDWWRIWPELMPANELFPPTHAGLDARSQSGFLSR